MPLAWRASGMEARVSRGRSRGWNPMPAHGDGVLQLAHAVDALEVERREAAAEDVGACDAVAHRLGVRQRG